MSRKPTIYDIARAAGVSPASVSRMIHQPEIVTAATREKITQAFALHGITPDALATKKRSTATSARGIGDNRTILFCIPSFDNPFYSEILHGIHEALLARQYQMIVSMEVVESNRIQYFLNRCSALQISGLILMYPLNEAALRQLYAVYPLVQCSEYNPYYQKVPFVSIDDYSISKMAVAHLVNCGCKKIAFFSSSHEYHYAQSRYRAYQAILSANGMAVRPEYVVQMPGFSYDRLLTAAERFFTLPDRPDAVFAVSDKHAHAVIKAGQMLGFRIPEDMKVIGFDDTMYATLSTPTISTVAQPQRQLGAESVRILLEMIQDPNTLPKSVLLPTHLLLREST